MIVLDTHAWVWFVNGTRQLSSRARSEIEAARAQKGIYISSISAWEVALLVATGRLELSMEVSLWIAKCEALPFLSFVPVDNAIFLQSVFLPGRFHADPADRVIVATALAKGAPVISRDRRIRNYSHVKAIW